MPDDAKLARELADRIEFIAECDGDIGRRDRDEIVRLLRAWPDKDAIRALVDGQAEDEGLWFVARTAPEAYLQQELRRLHAVIEHNEDMK